jgi:nucleoside 2-deoxyribosyltransferase
MKIYITTRFRGAKDNKDTIEKLCTAVRSAGIDDFNFVRDVENYTTRFDNPEDLWEASRKSINECDALLIDASDSPSGGRIIEAGMAFALKKPIIMIIKDNIEYKGFYNGICSLIIRYNRLDDITNALIDNKDKLW